jgi:hypothetical protein
VAKFIHIIGFWRLAFAAVSAAPPPHLETAAPLTCHSPGDPRTSCPSTVDPAGTTVSAA